MPDHQNLPRWFFPFMEVISFPLKEPCKHHVRLNTDCECPVLNLAAHAGTCALITQRLQDFVTHVQELGSAFRLLADWWKEEEKLLGKRELHAPDSQACRDVKAQAQALRNRVIGLRLVDMAELLQAGVSKLQIDSALQALSTIPEAKPTQSEAIEKVGAIVKEHEATILCLLGAVADRDIVSSEGIINERINDLITTLRNEVGSDHFDGIEPDEFFSTLSQSVRGMIRASLWPQMVPGPYPKKRHAKKRS
jgi:hypothetical protein